MTLHNFTRSLAQSHEFEDAPWWGEVYRAAFHNFAGMACVRHAPGDDWGQKGGIDRVITLSSGRTLRVDEKVRTKDYDDILLERWSDRDQQKAGWVQKDLACDYIAYAFVPSRRCYLLPFHELRRAWLRFGREWIATYPPVMAHNEGAGRRWTTESVAVPIEVLQEALKNVSLIRWTGQTELLPEVAA